MTDTDTSNPSQPGNPLYPRHVAAPEHEPTAMDRAIARDVERLAQAADRAESNLATVVALQDGATFPPEVQPAPMPGLLERIGAENRLAMKRSPSDWQPRTVTLGAQQLTQLAGRRPFRITIAIFNASASIQLYASTEEPASSTRTIQLAVVNGSSASLSIDTEGPVYASGALGTTVQVLETFDDSLGLADAAKVLARAVLAHKVTENA
jgi:hypothetical protein